MRKLIKKIFDIREGEGFKAFLMFSYIFLIIASLMIVKPIRNSLFLTNFGVERLPYAYVLVAVVAAFVVWIYSVVSKRVRLNYHILYTIISSIVVLLLSWLLLHMEYRGGWFLYAFYVWVTIFGVVTSAQFWLLANYVFNAREARRLFGFIGAGAISGGIFGGYLTNYFAYILKTQNLLFICMAFLVACTFLLWVIWTKSASVRFRERFKTGRSKSIEQDDNLLSIISKSRHLIYLAAIVGIGVIVANLADYQFSAIASSTIVDKDSLTAFFGFWLSTLSVISLVIQLFFTGKILKRFGVVASLLFLPLGIMVGAVAIVFFPVLWAAILIKVSDGSFKHSLNKAGIELLIVPIPAKIKNRAKSFIDVFIDNLATGIGGLLLIVFTIVLGFSLQHVSVIIVGLIAVWIYLIVRIRGEYIDSFRHAIEKRTIDFSEQIVNLQDAPVLKSFIRILEGNNERQILYVLKLFRDVQSRELVPYLQKLLGNPSDDIRTAVLNLAASYPELNLDEQARELIRQGSHEVRKSAIGYLCRRSENEKATLAEYLGDENLYISGSALLYAASKAGEDSQFREELKLKDYFDRVVHLEGYKSADKPEIAYIKSVAAESVGVAGDPGLYPYLHLLLNEKDPEVIRKAIVSAGRTREEEFISILISFLGKKHYRKLAREALAEFGEDVIPVLARYIEHESADRTIRSAIPRVLSLVGSPKSVKLLFQSIDQDDLLLRFEIIKALNRLKEKFPSLKIDKQKVNSGIYNETQDYFRLLTILNYQLSLRKSGRYFGKKDVDLEAVEKAQQLLIRALGERLDRHLERIFRLLGMRYILHDIYSAYLGIFSKKSDLRANAIEFLDNVLDPGLKKLIIPIVETGSPGVLLEKSRSLIRFDFSENEKCFEYILQGTDNWLKVCTIYFLAKAKGDRCRDSVARLVNDDDQIVKETAEMYINSIG